MIRHFRNKFQVTDEGARSLLVASLASFGVYVVSMFPVTLVMLLGDRLISGHEHGTGLYLSFSAATLIFLYAALWVEYGKLFDATYQESAHLRVSIAKKLKALPLSYFSKRNLSDLAQSIMSDVEAVEHAMSHSIPKIYGLYFFLPVLGGLLMAGNASLGLAVILPNLLRFGALSLYRKKTERGNEKFYGILRDNSEKFQEIIELHQEIKGFDLSKKAKDDLYRQMEYSEAEHVKTESTSVKTMALSSLFSFVSLGVVLVVGTPLLRAGAVSVLHLLGYLLAAVKVKEMVDVSSESALEILYIAPRVAKIREINDEKLQTGQTAELQRFDVELEHVGFAYDRGGAVLEDVSFSARQGEVTALVGTSGCGKTTLLRLISRLYDCGRGKILIDGKDISEIAVDSLFDKISIVFQDVILFNTSVLENIRIGRLSATDEEVKEAAKRANCMEFIEKLPQKFNSLIGENGAQLSGGERQRLSIARAFLKDAPILLLDEIAAGLDVENELKIQQSLNRLIQNKTVMVISHRLKSIENADKIVILDHGRVEHAGTHRRLMEQSGLYRNLILKSKLAEEFAY